MTDPIVQQPAQLVVGNNATCHVVGAGTITLTTLEKRTLTLHEVLYVPNMVKHLISVSKLLESGKMQINFEACHCVIREKGKHDKVVVAHLCDRLYCVKLSYRPQHSAHVTKAASEGHTDQSVLWHARLNHVNEQKLKLVTAQPHLYRLPVPALGNLPFCESCAQGKIKQQAYAHKSSYRANQLLELVHTDFLDCFLWRLPLLHAHSR